MRTLWKRQHKVLLVCGGRDLGAWRFVHEKLDECQEEIGSNLLVVHGAASGADSLADVWAQLRGHPRWVFPAQWQKLGNSAGPKRNALMATKTSPDFYAAFEGGTGTDDMVSRLDHVQGVRYKIPETYSKESCPICASNVTFAMTQPNAVLESHRDPHPMYRFKCTSCKWKTSWYESLTGAYDEICST